MLAAAHDSLRGGNYYIRSNHYTTHVSSPCAGAYTTYFSLLSLLIWDLVWRLGSSIGGLLQHGGLDGWVWILLRCRWAHEPNGIQGKTCSFFFSKRNGCDYR